jgi:toxin ParE1/3/4
VIELTWSPRAAADLEEIRDSIAADSPSYADLTVRRLVAATERLRQFPDLGRVVPERESIELREIISGRFRIVYRRRADVVEMVTVFRGSRQFLDIAP